jgi:hypothetical protein
MSVWAVNTPIKSSKTQQLIVVLLHATATLAIWVAYIPILAKVMVMLLLVLMLWLSWRQLTLQLASSIVALSIDDEQWTITLKSGQRLRVQLQTWAVWRYLMVLDVQARDVNSHYRVLLWPDSLKQADYRRLQVRLRLAGKQQKLRLLDDVM